MRQQLITAAFAIAAMTAGSAAQAFTVAAQPALAEDNIVRIAGGCGLGWHRGPWGGCRSNYGYRPYAYVAPGPGPGCWWRETPYGPRRVCAW